MNRKIGTVSGLLITLANVQISSNAPTTFNLALTNETSGSLLVRCTSTTPLPSAYTVTPSNGQIEHAVATTCTDNPAWQITNMEPGQTVVYYATFQNNPGLAQPFAFKYSTYPAISGIKLSQAAS